MKDYYKIMGLDESATPELIKKTYRTLSFKYHPDRNPDSLQAAHDMKELNEAYSMLSNPVKRALYDAERRPRAPIGMTVTVNWGGYSSTTTSAGWY